MKPIPFSIVFAVLIFASLENLRAQSGNPVPDVPTLRALKKEMKDLVQSPAKQRLARANQALQLGALAEQEKNLNKKYFLRQR